ncbi:cysteinyl-trna synthetase [Diplodia corticola]|uniref:cysteine--tRNA ligase n=1 Tax=Diplodia corticola TaxID=236234 RepID=A0A1J9S031_9PEZI|nr:cysteinyl-trna synthetase [Diplodia corticola]OJD33380.1 cysteinyl-trna synthetase [Diplodia corticola]
MSGRTQPPWQAPHARSDLPPLHVYNSLTRSKVPFVPIDGNKVSWYACGPTVYDDAHLGHARNYVSTDIIRRIMRDYFKYDVRFVMNITDVDDKIILRGRQQYILAKYVDSHPELDDETLSVAKKAFEAYLKKNLSLLPADAQPEQYAEEAKKAYGHVLAGKAVEGDGPPGDKEAKVKMHLKTASAAAEALILADAKKTSVTDFYTKAEDVLLPYLDSLYGHTIDANDHSIFTRLTQKFERRFMEDVRALNCLDPDVVTRVTEYGPQIVDFVEKVVKNGYGYVTSDGSVYFDIQAFEKDGNSYARLEPWNRNDKDLLADGEGALTKKSAEKRSDADFALWKSSKPGEPAWPSPWGMGRPGWHIECSAMASDVLGQKVDIHSGGIDLAFPHHDNELAQSEAFWAECKHDHQSHQWINYFLHMGHLSISGSKMSKSLKNFTTIREALGRGDWTPRSLRIVFLLGGWKEPVEITEGLVKEGSAWEEKVNNFFFKVKDLERHPSPENAASAEADSALQTAFSAAQTELDKTLCDSFDTPGAMQVVSRLITDYNSAATKASLSDATALTIGRWITKVVTIFGLDGIAGLSDANRIGWAGIDIPAPAQPFVYPVSALRDAVRDAAKSGTMDVTAIKDLASKDPAAAEQPADAVPYAEVYTQFQEDVKSLADKQAPAKDFLSLCDRLRDAHLWDLGIYLEDRDAQQLPALVRPLSADLIAAREQKDAQAAAKLAAKEKREREELERKAALAEKAKLSHLEMFRSAEYSAWDDEGLPVRDAKGEELPKSRTKKLRKEWERQKKLHEEWLAEQKK